VKLTLRLPARATHNYTRRDTRTVGVPVRILFDIPHDGSPVRQTLCVENRARDHHLRLRFPTGLATRQFEADARFDWRRYPAGHRQARIDSCAVAVAGGEAFGVVGDCPGLIDSRLDKRGIDLALTLFRAVDQVSHAVHRDVWVGEEGECLRTITRRFAWTTGSAADVRRSCLCARRTLVAPPMIVAVTPDARHRYLDAGAATVRVPEKSLVELRGQDLHLSAWKKADDGRGWIVRAYSLAERAQKAHLACAWRVKRAWRSGLDERRLSALRGLSFRIRPREIVTLRIELKEP
jgi:alpha-mannosidase